MYVCMYVCIYICVCIYAVNALIRMIISSAEEATLEVGFVTGSGCAVRSSSGTPVWFSSCVVWLVRVWFSSCAV